MNYKLLIIDDEVQFRSTLSNCFPWEQVGFELAGQVSEGRSALEFLKKNTVHALLCDINMPTMDGIELIRNLNTWENPPVTIFISGYREFEYAQQAIALGVRFYILKPIKYEDLMHTLSVVKKELDKRYGVIQEASLPLPPDPFVKDVRNYVEKNLSTANLKDLSNRLYMNSCYVSQLFKQKTDQNFSEYVFEVRMKRAAELLTTTGDKIYNIGSAVGYANPKNFARAFLSFYGMTPTDYRERHRPKSLIKEDDE